MAMNMRWGRAGWGRTPSAPRRQMPPSFVRRPDIESDPGRYGIIGARADNSFESFFSEAGEPSGDESGFFAGRAEGAET